MAVSVKHPFESEKADGPDPTLIQPSDWNAEHTVTLAGKRLMGRFAVADGEAQEVTVGTGLELTDAGALNTTIVALVPIGAVVDWPSNALPSKWLWCAGQAINRTTYAALFAVVGTTFGAGNGTTTFNVPDARGRVIAGKDDMNGSTANRLTNSGTGNSGIAGGSLGAAGGVDRHAITVAQMPTHSHGGVTGANGSHSHTYTLGEDTTIEGGTGDHAFTTGTSVTRSTQSVGDHTHSISSNGGGDAHPNVQPTLVLNKIIYAGV